MRALGLVLTGGEVRTRDLGGTATTSEFADAVRRALELLV
jgi:isocitrate/isopropylmalate dehydrogenase